METNEIYLLKKNMQLENENFIVKKGTYLKVVGLHDASDDLIPTKVLVQFDKINGHYLINEVDFKNQLENNSLYPIAAPKYQINDCVTHQNHGNGTVTLSNYDKILKTYLYTVKFKTGSLVVLENDLRNCQ